MPDKLSTKTYDTLVKLVQDHFDPKPSFIAERYKYSQCNQYEQESVAEYIVQLKQLLTYCKFGDKLLEYLRDRLVSEIQNEVIK